MRVTIKDPIGFVFTAKILKSKKMSGIGTLHFIRIDGTNEEKWYNSKFVVRKRTSKVIFPSLGCILFHHLLKIDEENYPWLDKLTREEVETE